jgi:hypothetical protein
LYNTASCPSDDIVAKGMIAQYTMSAQDATQSLYEGVLATESAYVPEKIWHTVPAQNAQRIGGVSGTYAEHFTHSTACFFLAILVSKQEGQDNAGAVGSMLCMACSTFGSFDAII